MHFDMHTCPPMVGSRPHVRTAATRTAPKDPDAPRTVPAIAQTAAGRHRDRRARLRHDDSARPVLIGLSRPRQHYAFRAFSAETAM
jgi:hypothetical protein